MKSISEINIERLTKRDRELLEQVRANLSCQKANVAHVASKYEGKLHTKLDRALCELRDCLAGLGEIVG